MNANAFLWADWPAPKQIRALTTTRLGGVSLPPYDQLNLGGHCGDNPTHVDQNRHQLQTALQFAHAPLWLNQVHGAGVFRCTEQPTRSIRDTPPEADASTTRLISQPCVVMTADCLPILLCNQAGTEVAAIHGGWRSLQQGIIANTVNQMTSPADTLMAWLGPAIGPKAFEVGTEVLDAFKQTLPQTEQAFSQHKAGHCMADIFQIARLLLQASGVQRLHGGDICTVSDAARFYSYRRDGGQTGRMASCIWIAPTDMI